MVCTCNLSVFTCILSACTCILYKCTCILWCVLVTYRCLLVSYGVYLYPIGVYLYPVGLDLYSISMSLCPVVILTETADLQFVLQVDFITKGETWGKWSEGKGKVHHTTCYEGPQGGIELWLYSILTSAVDWGGWSRPRPGRFTPGNKTPYALNRRQCGLVQLIWRLQFQHFKTFNFYDGICGRRVAEMCVGPAVWCCG